MSKKDSTRSITKSREQPNNITDTVKLRSTKPVKISDLYGFKVCMQTHSVSTAEQVIPWLETMHLIWNTSHKDMPSDYRHYGPMSFKLATECTRHLTKKGHLNHLMTDFQPSKEIVQKDI